MQEALFRNGDESTTIPLYVHCDMLTCSDNKLDVGLGVQPVCVLFAFNSPWSVPISRCWAFAAGRADEAQAFFVCVNASVREGERRKESVFTAGPDIFCEHSLAPGRPALISSAATCFSVPESACPRLNDAFWFELDDVSYCRLCLRETLPENRQKTEIYERKTCDKKRLKEGEIFARMEDWNPRVKPPHEWSDRARTAVATLVAHNG